MRHIKLINYLNQVIHEKRDTIGARTLRDLKSNEKRCRSAKSFEFSNAIKWFEICETKYELWYPDKLIMPHRDIVVEFEWNDGHAFVVWFQQRKGFARAYFYLCSSHGIWSDQGQCDYPENVISLARWKNGVKTQDDPFLEMVYFQFFNLFLPKIDVDKSDPRPKVNDDRVKLGKEKTGEFFRVGYFVDEEIREADNWKGSRGLTRKSPREHTRAGHHKVYNKGTDKQKIVYTPPHIVGRDSVH